MQWFTNAVSWLCASGRRVVTAIVVNVAVCAGVFALLEHTDYVEGLYWAVTTATTTGYGDISPASALGRTVGMWLMVSSVALVALATARLAARLVQDPHLFSHEEQEELKDDVDDVHEMLVRVCEKLGVPVPVADPAVSATASTAASEPVDAPAAEPSR